MMDTKWKYRLTLRYNDNAKPPRKPGTAACVLFVATRSALETEVAAAEQRGDVDVEVVDINVD